MVKKHFKISGVGCALVDYLFTPINFSGETFSRYISVRPGDGGLSPGKLVFRDEFEAFSGRDYMEVRELLTAGNSPLTLNIGGPSIVSLIHAAQMLDGTVAEVYFYGSKGRDKDALFIDERLQKTPLKTGKYKVSDQYTAFTDVLSDPGYDQGLGERIFINNIGAAWDLYPEDMDEAFFESDMVIFGGTALVPHIHRSLLELLKKAKAKKSVTVVNTVYDFLNERSNPGKAWPLGSTVETYRYIDLLIADMEEALRLSGQATIAEALSFFKRTGVGAVIVTHGANPLYYFCNSKLFGRAEGCKLVSERVRNEIVLYPERVGDTTGCGDNFAGGAIASIAEQMMDPHKERVNIDEVIAWATVSGGYACFYHGGTFYEEYPGQKRELIEPYYRDYQLQKTNRPFIPDYR
ncbi:carbohydrate kinase family protein [Proteiniphilum acetatigenes]|uniref:carbohydrate kinase family protein n=1 Tax=Proteiniphilum acetatigenes TaxID=294710 RepID=UPI00037E2C5C|nr:carbohydrate kinase family protein [Proteiniphilum acetatigenes]SFL45128.1 Sugar or nucleoside kinase, ribokinase family [Porphyromonadaceae bacterium KH3CP3RA]